MKRFRPGFYTLSFKGRMITVHALSRSVMEVPPEHDDLAYEDLLEISNLIIDAQPNIRGQGTYRLPAKERNNADSRMDHP